MIKIPYGTEKALPVKRFANWAILKLENITSPKDNKRMKKQAAEGENKFVMRAAEKDLYPEQEGDKQPIEEQAKMCEHALHDSGPTDDQWIQKKMCKLIGH